ncbi:MAG: metallophosphoesterase family protein, partial [Verrucomicrobiota bacterium]
MIAGREWRNSVASGCFTTVATFFLLGCLLAQAEPVGLVSVGDSWRYFLATNAPPAEWNQTNFDDSSWPVRPSGFSSGRTFEILEATLWPPATNYNSVFLRNRFLIEDAPAVRWLTLRIDYNDGFVAYLNGHEIARRGLTNNPVVWNEEPVFHPGGSAEQIDVTPSIDWLQSGENLLAIEVHNATNSTPVIPASASVMVLPELLANFTRGPYLQNVSTSSVQIIWQTPFPSDSVVEYGIASALGSMASGIAFSRDHVVGLLDLQPDTKYWYRVRSASTSVTVTSPVATFRTFRTNGPVVFHVFGDTGGQVVQQASGIVPQYAIAELLAQHPADLVLHCGDVVYPNFSPGREDTHFLSIYRHLMRSVPVFATMGNHEFDSVSGGQTYLDTFFLPTNSASGTEHFYSFDHGDVHFVSLFVPQLNWGGEPPNCGCLPELALTNGSAQYSWLVNDLAASTKPWKILFFH